MKQRLFTFKKLGGLLVMFALAKQALGVPPHFKSGKHSKRGAVGAAGSKLSRKAAQGKLAGAVRGF
jgi:hypothetical protein